MHFSHKALERVDPYILYAGKFHCKIGIPLQVARHLPLSVADHRKTDTGTYFCCPQESGTIPIFMSFPQSFLCGESTQFFCLFSLRRTVYATGGAPPVQIKRTISVYSGAVTAFAIINSHCAVLERYLLFTRERICWARSRTGASTMLPATSETPAPL